MIGNLIFFHSGKPNIISVWAENSVGLVTQKATGTVVIDKTPPKAGNVSCPAYIQVKVHKIAYTVPCSMQSAGRLPLWIYLFVMTAISPHNMYMDRVCGHRISHQGISHHDGHLKGRWLSFLWWGCSRQYTIIYTARYSWCTFFFQNLFTIYAQKCSSMLTFIFFKNFDIMIWTNFGCWNNFELKYTYYFSKDFFYIKNRSFL